MLLRMPIARLGARKQDTSTLVLKMAMSVGAVINIALLVVWLRLLATNLVLAILV